MSRFSKFLCWLGSHKWDQPGGHCMECGKCDELLGKHDHVIHYPKHSGNCIGAPRGGCWFCGYDGDGMHFSCEFDTYFHMDCLTAALKDPFYTEAQIIGREFYKIGTKPNVRT